MHEAGRLDELRALLLTPEWLNAQLRAIGPYAVMRAFGWVRGDRDLEMIHGAVRLSLPALASDPSQFCEQLSGRLQAGISVIGWTHSGTPCHALQQSLGCTPGGPTCRDPPAGSCKPCCMLPGSTARYCCPTGHVLSWSNDATLRVWNLATGEGDLLTGHDDLVTGALLLPDEEVVSWSADWTLRVSNPMTR